MPALLGAPSGSTSSGLPCASAAAQRSTSPATSPATGAVCPVSNVTVMHRILLTFALACAGLAGFQSIRAQVPGVGGNDAFLAAHRTAVAANPAGVEVTLRLAGGRSRFKQGEIVALELVFTNTGPGTYTLSPRAYDRSGRLDVDEISVDPREGVVDPLHDYYHCCMFGFAGGGLSSMPAVLTAESQVIPLDVNEWWRFDRPGRFRLYVTSRRVEPRPWPDPPDHSAWPRVTSNIIEIEVETGGPVGFDEARAPGRVLRFAGTQAAAREMARRLLPPDADQTAHRVGSDTFECRYGLIGSPHRRFLVPQMEGLLDAAPGGVSRAFIETLAILAAVLQSPVPPPDSGVKPAVELAERGRRDGEYRRLLDRYTARAARRNPAHARGPAPASSAADSRAY